jgi:hypothetical protein
MVRFIAEMSLVDLPDETIMCILAHLDFLERSKLLRGVSHRLLRLVDSMPQPYTLQFIILKAAEVVPSWSVKWRRSTSRITINLHIVESQNEENAHPSIPALQLRALRPTKLCVLQPVEEEATDEPVLLEMGLLRHLVADVAGSVTELHITGLTTTSMLAWEQTFSMFTYVTQLFVESVIPLDLTLSAVMSLRSLISLTLSLRPEMLSLEQGRSSHTVGLQLAMLSSLPRLRKLSILVGEPFVDTVVDFLVEDDVATNFMLGCSALGHIKILSISPMLSEFTTVWALATMISRLEKLEELSMLHGPGADLWAEVNAVGGHRRLRKLVVKFDSPEAEQLEALVHACNLNFPALVHLELQICDLTHHCSSDDVVLVLSNLLGHPSLSIVTLGLLYQLPPFFL